MKEKDAFIAGGIRRGGAGPNSLPGSPPQSSGSKLGADLLAIFMRSFIWSGFDGGKFECKLVQFFYLPSLPAAAVGSCDGGVSISPGPGVRGAGEEVGFIALTRARRQEARGRLTAKGVGRGWGERQQVCYATSSPNTEQVWCRSCC